MNAALQRLVWRRAHSQCEYCQLSSHQFILAFEIDHIIAEQHGGATVAENLAVACFSCNHHKGPNLSGVDPRTRKPCWLFNPRKNRWNDHFRWDGPVLIGLTSIGRTSIRVLAINLPVRISQRSALMKEGLFHIP